MKNRLSLDEAIELRRKIRLEQEEIIFGSEEGPGGNLSSEDAAQLRELSAELKGIEAQYLEEFKVEESVSLLDPVFEVMGKYHELLYTVFENPHKDPAPLFKKFQATLQRDITFQMQNIELDLLPFLERHGIRFDEFVQSVKTGDYYKETTAKIFMIDGTDAKIDALLTRITATISSFEAVLTDAFVTLHDNSRIVSGEIVNGLMNELNPAVESFLSIANDELIPYCESNGFDPFQILVDLFDQLKMKEDDPRFEGDLLDEGMEVDIESLNEDFDDFDDDGEGHFKNNYTEEDDAPDDDFDDDDFKPGKNKKGW